jgi:hypothetical protein
MERLRRWRIQEGSDFAQGEGLAVVANGFNRAAFFGFLATSFFVRIFRLFEDEGVTAVVVAFEIIRSGFAAEIAVNALIVHVVFASNVFRIFVCYISHKFAFSGGKICGSNPVMASIIWIQITEGASYVF